MNSSFWSPAGHSLDVEQAARTALLVDGNRHAAFTLLVRAYGEPLQRFCRRVLRGEASAEDVYQTVLIQAFQDLPRFSGRSTFRAWLYVIARNRCRDVLKAGRSRDKYVEARAEMPESPALEATPEEHLLSQANLKSLREGLQHLPSEMRHAVTLRYDEQLSYEEMAELCQEPAATLRVRVARALQRLRDLLRAHGPDR